jgi:hypothetical protein
MCTCDRKDLYHTVLYLHNADDLIISDVSNEEFSSFKGRYEDVPKCRRYRCNEAVDDGKVACTGGPNDTIHA